MKIHYALLAGLCIAQLQAADESQPTTFDLNEVSVELLKDHPELASECSRIWYDTMGHKNYPDYEPIKEGHTKFIETHANDTTFPIMLVALLNAENKKKVIGEGALRATCYPRKGEVIWADENPECTPWLTGACVAEEYQKQGVGTQIALQLFKHAYWRLGLETIYLHSEDETNQKIYEKNGAEKVADVMREDKKNNRQVPGIVYKINAHKAFKQCQNRTYGGIVE